MQALDFKTAFKYPFNRAVGMLNILWILLPIIGWFALGGYAVRIIKEFTEGKYEKLPMFSFGKDLELGFMMFIKSIPFFVAYMIVTAIFQKIPAVGGLVSFFLSLFIIPILSINFLKKQTVASYFEFDVTQAVFNNLGDYLMAVIKAIGLAIVFLIMCIVLVGIPAMQFTNNMFLADFYRRHVK